MKEDRKKIGETRFGQFLSKAGGVIAKNGGNVLDLVAKAATGDITGAIGEVREILGKAQDDPETEGLLAELEIYKLDWTKEMYALEIQDRDSARNREIEVAKTGRHDWLMYAAGVTALGTFIMMVVAVIFLDLEGNSLFHQLMGIIEGVALSVFGYYFGSSKGSKDKQGILDQLRSTR